MPQSLFTNIYLLVGASLLEVDMVSNHLEFETRLRRLMRKHRAMSNGYTMRMQPDGLIVAKPRRASRISGRSVLIFLAAFLLFKGFLIANLGAEGYGERISRLESGTFVEKAGAFAMQIDPLSELVSQKLRPLLH
ncbi:hypothetical protein [Arenibacterium sp. CAU 1754]